MMARHSGLDAASHRAVEMPPPAASTSHFIEAGGLRLHYLDYGTAGRRPMLCIPGGGAHAHWFDFVASGFSADHHVRALDNRGHGDSAWPEQADYSYQRFAADIAEVVEKLDLRDFVLVGHSMGGMISLVYAAQHPGRVSRLVIVDSRPVMNDKTVAGMREFGARPGASYPTLEALVARYRLKPADTTASPELIRYLGGFSGRQQADGSWRHKFDRRVYAERQLVDSLACWRALRIPVLLARAGLSRRVTPEMLNEARAQCPQLEVTEVADSYHHVTLDNPAGLVREVRAFLARHP